MTRLGDGHNRAGMSGMGHLRRFLRVRATSGYPPKLTVNVDGADRQPSALGRQRAVAPSHGSGEHRNEGEDYRFREENAPDIADSLRSR